MLVRRTAAALTTAAALSVSGVALATPALAAPNNNANQTGLINLAVQDTTIQAPIGVAANLCGVAVNVLSAATNVSDVDCTADGVSLAQADGNGGNNSANQTGLVNVALQDTTVQVPVALAANICGVSVNIVAAFTNVEDVDCEALAMAEANA